MQRITINLERLKYPHTGLYHYCLQLGRALVATTPAEYQLQLYGPATATALFPASAHWQNQQSWHKLFNPYNWQAELWHASNQNRAYFPKNSRLKKALTIHDLNYYHDSSKSMAKRNSYLASVKKMVAMSDHVIGISQFALNELAEYGIRPASSSVIYNGCNIPDRIAVQEAPLAGDRPYLFSIGTITQKKNFHVLPGLLVGNDRLLVIAGVVQQAAYVERIVAEAQRLGVSDRVRMAGPISESEKYNYYTHCEAFVFPSLQEGFGLPVVEAMAFGKPVFLSNATALPEIGGELAYYFDDFDPEAMHQVFANGMRDYRQQQPERSAALRHRAELFSWSNAAAQHWKLYDQLLR